MNDHNHSKSQLLKFFVATYLIFGILFALTGVVMALKAPTLLQYIMPVICAWSPTFVFLLLFKKLYPKSTLKEFLKQQFCSPVKLSLYAIIISVQLLIFFGITYSYSIINHISAISILPAGASVVILGFFDQLIRGPLGEEIGWRGYALNELQKKHSPLAASVILGVVWGFWHTPLWLVTSGCAGLQLIEYITLFMIGIILVSITITAFYNIGRNLILPVVIHLFFNLTASMIQIDALQTLLYMDIFYLVFAILLLIINPQKALYGAKR